MLTRDEIELDDIVVIHMPPKLPSIQQKLKQLLKESNDAIKLIDSKVHYSKKTKCIGGGLIVSEILGLFFLITALIRVIDYKDEKKTETVFYIMLPFVLFSLALNLYTLYLAIPHVKHYCLRQRRGLFEPLFEEFDPLTPGDILKLKPLFRDADEFQQGEDISSLITTGQEARRYGVFFREQRDMLGLIIARNNKLHKTLLHKTKSPLKDIPGDLVEVVCDYAYEDLLPRQEFKL